MSLSTVRISSLPAGFACPGSVRAPEVSIRESAEAASIGSAVHELLDRMIAEDMDSTAALDVAGVAARWQVDADEVGRLTWYGLKAWREIRDHFLDAMPEVPLIAEVGGVRLTGHPDLYAVRPPRAAVLDWKTGRLDVDYSEQIRGYCALVMLEHPDVEEVTGTIVWLRDQEIESYTLRRADLPAWVARFRRRIVEWDGTYSPGPHCRFCPRTHDCPALRALARRDVEIMAGPELAERIETGLADIPQAERVALLRRWRLVRKIGESLEEAIRQRVELEGPHDAGDGTELRLVSEARREVDPLAAWSILQARLKDEEMAGVIKVSLSKAETAVAAKAPRGKGAAAKRDLAEALEQAGAISRREICKLKEVRKNR